MNKRTKTFGMIIITAALMAANQFVRSFALNVLQMAAIVFTVGYILRDIVKR